MSFLKGKRVGGPAAARLTADGHDYINFTGAGYLALSNVTEVRSAVRDALDSGVPFFQHVPAQWGAHDRIFKAVEQAGAKACGSEASVYLPTGYLIGAVALAALHDSFEVILLDENAHYNLRDAASAKRVPTLTFEHCNPSALLSVLRSHLKRGQRPLVMTDGIFAISGRLAPLDEYAAILKPWNGHLVVDESHAFGVVGNCGRGASEFCDVESVAMRGATLGKAFCAQGAIVGCTVAQAEYLRTVPPIRGACAGSPLSAIAATSALRYAESRPELRLELSAKARSLRDLLRGIGLSVIESPAPIVSFVQGDELEMRRLQRELWEHAICVTYSTYVGAGPCGIIRCAVYRDHSEDDLQALTAALRESLRNPQTG